MDRAERLQAPNYAWRTPKYLFQALQAEFGRFDLDAAASKQNALVRQWLGPDSPFGPEYYDALIADWGDWNPVFCNPPYGRELKTWMEKFVRESRNRTIVVLINASVGSLWWNRLVVKEASEIRFLVGRVGFLDENGIAVPDNQYDSVVVVYRPEQAFMSHGPLVRWWDWQSALS